MLVEFPEKLAPLFESSRWKSVRGGRDGGKSWGVARAFLEIGATQREFIVCARETMESIKDSVHRLLVDQIQALGLTEQYGVEKSLIWHRGTGTEFVFRGLKNPDALKSLEGATKVWIEEAQSVSEDSWRKVPPTVRRPGSEIWLTWNPELETDPTWKRFVVRPPEEGFIEIIINFSDNPFASAVLIPERKQLQRDDPDEYAHVWLGQPRRQLEGAIYANELRLAESQGRIMKVPYQPGVPVGVGWDLGDSDIMAMWFIQSVMGQHRVINYYENRHKSLEHYLGVCEGMSEKIGDTVHHYQYGRDFFPWDAASKVLVGALETTMRQRGRNVQVLPRMSREVGIDAVREMLGTCWFDVDKCADGLQRLRYYRYGETKLIDPLTQRLGMKREPLHDDNSHGADAFRSYAMGFKPPKKETPATPPGFRQQIRPPRVSGGYSPFG